MLTGDDWGLETSLKSTGTRVCTQELQIACASVQYPWDNDWVVLPGSKPVRGGQGTSFLAANRSDSGSYVFIKTLNRPKSLEARKRFRREVTAYETLVHPGMPRLIEHNGSKWPHLEIPLYLVLEYVPGPTLGHAINDLGPLDLATATACISAVSQVLDACHREEVIHRDLKPSNIILRDGNSLLPVVVDFGLSFNHIDTDLMEVTRVSEEVGNRFLRLPEQASGGRSPVSDVTQLSGLLFFALTGVEPRVLTDEEGNKPHQRIEPAAILERTIGGPRLMRLNSVFDRSFDPRLQLRFQSALDFQKAVNSVLSDPPLERPDFDALVVQFEDTLNRPSHIEQVANSERLQTLTRFATRELSTFAQGKGLSVTQTGGGPDFSTPNPSALLQLALSVAGEGQHSWVRYRFELRGPSDAVLIVDGDELWRGKSPTPTLSEVVKRSAIEAFLRRADEAAT